MILEEKYSFVKYETFDLKFIVLKYHWFFNDLSLEDFDNIKSFRSLAKLKLNPFWESLV